MDLKEYQRIQDQMTKDLSKDPMGKGHVYEIDLECMDRVCSCGAVFGRGQRWKQPCPNKK